METVNSTVRQTKSQTNGHYSNEAANDSLQNNSAELQSSTWQGEDVYLLRADISALTLIDQINRCLAQAGSMATLMVDSDFNTWSNRVISAYGESIRDRIDEANLLANELWEKHRKFIYSDETMK